MSIHDSKRVHWTWCYNTYYQYDDEVGKKT